MATTGSSAHSHTYTSVTGPTGPAGPQGVKGATGAAGAKGATGVPDPTLVARVAALEAFVLTITDVPTKPPVVPPVPPVEPPVVTGATFFISPTGSDSTGNGSLANPWASIAKFINISPAAGAILYCRGGYYYNPSVAQAGHGKPVLPGTAGAPITIRNYPGETPIFSGGTDLGAFILIYDASTYVVIDGLEFEERDTSNADGGTSYQGLIVVGGWTDGVNYTTLHTTIRRCKFRLKASYNARGHAIYFSGGSRYGTVEDCEIVGAVTGRSVNVSHGLQVYGGDGGGHVPAATDLTIQRNIFRNWESFANALILWDDGGHNLRADVLHNSFISNGNDIRAELHGAITIRDNATTKASGSGWLYDPNDSAQTTQDHNFNSQTFDGTYHLNVGQTGRNAASDGTDAGALS
jgi:hypothetical protein